jgi:hypothetical protein
MRGIPGILRLRHLRVSAKDFAKVHEIAAVTRNERLGTHSLTVAAW